MFSFLNRGPERDRLARFLKSRSGGFAVLYGRRRCGKSRLLLEAVADSPAVYYVGDDREAGLQRAAVATEIARLIPGFDAVTYPDWDALLSRWWKNAPPRAVLALDEFPLLVTAAPELPSVLQKQIDRSAGRGPRLILCGSSQRMMHDLVLDANAPLYGRAKEIMRIVPLGPHWIRKALAKHPVRAVEHYATWGGIPRYWELAAEFRNLPEAIRRLILDPLGILHHEPQRLLLDDVRDVSQSVSILFLIGQGAHRISEIAARLEKPVTALSRPMQRLCELGLVKKHQPFGADHKNAKKSLYKIHDPFLLFWFRFVERNRSRLESGQVDQVWKEIERDLPGHFGMVWEELSRASVARMKIHGREWKPASSWWGAGRNREPMEIDIVAESADGKALLIGEAKWSSRPAPLDARRLAYELERKTSNFPDTRNRKIYCALWTIDASKKKIPGITVLGPDEVLTSLK